MKRCLLVGAAPSHHEGLDYILQTQTFDAIYAVDGGYATLIQRDIMPDAVFGDFDSLGCVPDHPVVCEYDSRKDFTDMDLAIHQALLAGYDDLVLCDAFVGRLDHTLGNLQLLIQVAARGVRIWGISEDEVIVPLVAPGSFSALFIEEGAWGTFSVISHSDVAEGVTEVGLEYRIEGGTCLNRAVWGISNELVGKPAHISLTEGSLWVMLPLKELSRVLYGGAFCS